MKNKVDFNDFNLALQYLVCDCVSLLEKWKDKNLKQQENSISVFMEYASAKHFQYHLAAIAAFSQSKKNRDLALENLRDEVGGNHPRLGREFCEQIGITPSKKIGKIIWSLDQSIENKKNAVFVTGFLAACEKCSPIIMRSMMDFSQKMGVKESIYLETHSGELEEHHASILLQGLQAEVKVSKTDFGDALEGLKEWRRLLNFCFS